MLSPKIETERLILRRYKETDIDAIYDIITDKRLSTYIKFPELTKEQELECIKEWIEEANDSKYERWVIERKEDGAIVGNIDVNTVVKKHNYCNVGYWFSRIWRIACNLHTSIDICCMSCLLST